MERLKVCFVGIGSIAKRHIRNLQSICSERSISLVIDAYRRTPEQLDGVSNVYCTMDSVPNDYDIIFITNPTNLHLTTLEDFHDKGKHFFIEKPVVSPWQIEEAKHFKTYSDSVYYVACPLRYSSVIQYIKKSINPDDVLSVRSISSSYLPDWRVGQDYRKTYSARKDMGGGVGSDLIHEWDYLTYLFGWPCRVKNMMGKKSELEIDSEDYAIYLAEYIDKIVELHLDYFGRKTIREIQLFTKTDTIMGDISKEKITYLCTGKCIEFDESRDDYQKREIVHFLNMIDGVEPVEDGFNHGLRVLELSDREL